MQKVVTLFQDGPFSFFPFFYFTPRLFAREPCEFRQACVIFWRGVIRPRGIGRRVCVCACACACVCVCVRERERERDCPSHGNLVLLIKSARAARVWGRCWRHNAHAHTNTHTHTLTCTYSQTNICAHTHTHRDSGADGGPTAEPVMCGQRIDVDRLHLLLLLLNTQQMAEAQPNFSLSHFVLLFRPPLRSHIHPFFLSLAH